MKRFKSLISSLFYILCVTQFSVYSQTAHAESIDIPITIDSTTYQNYLTFLDGRDPLTISHFKSNENIRDIVEVILLLQAFKRGGLDANVQFISGAYYAENLTLLANGDVAMAAESIWYNATKPYAHKIYITKPVLKKGQYFAGIYTLPKNEAVLSINKIEDLAQFKTLSNKHWTADWETLKQLNVGQLIHADNWLAMLIALEHQSIDFLLAPFQSTHDLRFNSDGITLVPVNNLRVLLNDSRHWVVSKNYPQADKIFHALEVGLAQLRDQGIINQAYNESGFHNPKVKNWRILNP